MRVKEFNSDASIDIFINKWLEENPEVKVIDIKYSSNEYGSNALVMYEL